MRSGLPRSLVEGACSIEASFTADISLTAAAPSTALRAVPLPRFAGKDEEVPASPRAVAENETNTAHSVIAMARSAMRSRTPSFSVALLSWPQAARMSRPRGVRTGAE